MAAPWIISDALWERIEPLLPVRPAGKTGLKPLPDRQVLQGIVFVLYTGIRLLHGARPGAYRNAGAAR